MAEKRKPPVKPEGLETPGLKWRPRAEGFVAMWIAREDIVKKGYDVKTVRLWPPSEGERAAAPTDAEWKYISSECIRLQDDMLGWSRALPVPLDRPIETINDLVRFYRQDPDSRYHAIRSSTRAGYDQLLDEIESAVGGTDIPAVTGRVLIRWHKTWSAARTKKSKDGNEITGAPRMRWAHGLITMLRTIVGFGVLMEDAVNDPVKTGVLTPLQRLDLILSKIDFPLPQRRTEQITAEHAKAIIAEALKRGWRSVALAQAFAFECWLRQKDVIGDWEDQSEPGLSFVTDRGQKWLYGIDWREISDDLILEHRLSKSLKGRDAIMNPKAGKTKRFDLKERPMIMELIADRVGPEKRIGPVIVCESTGLPYRQRHFMERWRECADTAGVPREIWQMDSRAGGITEATDADGSEEALDAVRQGAGHSHITTTLGYSRDTLTKDRKVAQLRVKSRKNEGDGK